MRAVHSQHSAFIVADSKTPCFSCAWIYAWSPSHWKPTKNETSWACRQSHRQHIRKKYLPFTASATTYLAVKKLDLAGAIASSETDFRAVATTAQRIFHLSSDLEVALYFFGRCVYRPATLFLARDKEQQEL
jgi:hypothetical protein